MKPEGDRESHQELRFTCPAQCNATVMLDALGRDRVARPTTGEVWRNIDFFARCNDLEINRSGVITREKLARYIRLSGVESPLQ